MLTLVITACVVLAPYLYYYVWDNHFETYFYGDGGYSFEDADGNADFDDIRALVLSKDAIWVEEDINTTSATNAQIYSETESAVSLMLDSLGGNEYISSALKSFLDTEFTVDYCSSVVVSGTVGGAPVSVSMIYVNMISEEGYATVLLNRKNDKVYQFTYSKTAEYGIFDSVSDYDTQGINNYLSSALIEYEEAADKIDFEFGITPYDFDLYVFGYEYYEIRSGACSLTDEYYGSEEMIQ